MTELLVITCMHFDPTWRRCFDRRFTYGGQSFLSYAELEGYHIEDNLALAERHPEYRFDIESALVVRKHLEHHPENLPKLQALARAGRFRIGGAGDNVIDGNMVLGESLVRNFCVGQRWVEKTFGFTPRLALRNDAFGNPAQLPQILRGSGFSAVSGLSYTPCPKPYWRGLDGSVIACVGLPAAASGSSCRKYAPCAACRGNGCVACRMRGIEEASSPLPGRPDLSHADARGAATVWIGSEEMLPNPAIVEWVEAQRAEHSIRFACQDEQLAYFEDQIAALAHPPTDEVFEGELNPNNAGCWVTRIKTKQVCRRQEYALLAVESLLALGSQGAPSPTTRAELERVWQDLLFTMFHDAITATHVDAAYEELEAYWQRIDEAVEILRGEALGPLARPHAEHVTVANMTGGAATTLAQLDVSEDAELSVRTLEGEAVPLFVDEDQGKRRVSFLASAVPAYGTREYKLVRDSEGQSEEATDSAIPTTFENSRFRVTADERGLTSIFDKKLARELTRADGLRPFELVLERDYGSPWATLFADRRRAPLAHCTRLVSHERARGVERLVFAGRPATRVLSNQSHLDFRMTVTLVEGLERIDFALRAHWDSHSTRLRVALPLAFGGEGVYGVPYGRLVRPEYEGNYEDWTGANGDWPAVDWAGVEGTDVAVALLNRGLPSYCTETAPLGMKTLFLSLLRSPTDGTYLNEPEYYSMPEYLGMRDAGHHELEFALTAYGCRFSESSVVDDATVYNAGLMTLQGLALAPLDVPRLESSVARVSAVKPADEGTGLAVRVFEHRGRGGSARLALPTWCRAAVQTNLRELEARPLTIADRAVTLELRPFEITTVLLRP